MSHCWAKREVLRDWKGFIWLHRDSLFKVGEAADVASQLHHLLRFGATVLDDAHPGLIGCKLERKAFASDSVFWFGCACVLSPVNISMSHPP